MNKIVIRHLAVQTHIGVPDKERAEPQKLLVTVEIEPLLSFAALQDHIERTVDYDAVARSIRALAGRRPRRLIETFAEEIAALILQDFRARRVSVEIRKFILPDTDYVAVHCVREKVG
jgi:7,8-dihydroneopterin aldolase/epimerase/oxygenase